MKNLLIVALIALYSNWALAVDKLGTTQVNCSNSLEVKTFPSTHYLKQLTGDLSHFLNQSTMFTLVKMGTRRKGRLDYGQTQAFQTEYSSHLQSLGKPPQIISFNPIFEYLNTIEDALKEKYNLSESELELSIVKLAFFKTQQNDQEPLKLNARLHGNSISANIMLNSQLLLLIDFALK